MYRKIKEEEKKTKLKAPPLPLFESEEKKGKLKAPPLSNRFTLYPALPFHTNHTKTVIPMAVFTAEFNTRFCTCLNAPLPISTTTTAPCFPGVAGLSA